MDFKLLDEVIIQQAVFELVIHATGLNRKFIESDTDQ
ncbi:MAG: hypothetical protein RIR52_1983 [Acidobacteriota bacterium]